MTWGRRVRFGARGGGGVKLIKLFVGVDSRQMVVKGKIIDKYPTHKDTTSYIRSYST